MGDPSLLSPHCRGSYGRSGGQGLSCPLNMGSYFVRMKRATPRKLFRMVTGLQDPYTIQKYIFYNFIWVLEAREQLEKLSGSGTLHSDKV